MRKLPFVALFFIAVPFLLLAPLMVSFATPIALRMTQDGTLQPVSNNSSSNSGQSNQSFSLNVPSIFILVPAIVIIACCFIRYLVPIGRTIRKEKAPPSVNKARLILALVSIFIVVGPLGATLIAYSGNLSGVFTPSNVNKLTSMLSNQSGLEVPNVTNSWCNLTSGTLFLQFNFTNPTAISLRVISASANVTDHSDGYPLGQISLPNAVTVGADETMTFQMIGTLSEEATTHVATAHAGESSFDVDLSNENINCAGIMLQINETSTIDNVLIVR